MMPPEREDLQRRLEAFHQSLSNLGAKRKEASPNDPTPSDPSDPTPSPPSDPSPSGHGLLSRGRALLALALVAAAVLSGTVIARTLRPGAPACATGGITPTAVVVGDSISTVTAPAGP